MNKLLKELCTEIAVSGREDALREYIRAEVSPYCERVYTDHIGNLICEKKGDKPSKNKVMLCAHMDEVGFIITSITSGGFLKFSCVGGIDEKVFLGKRCEIATKNGIIKGVFGLTPTHLLSDKTAVVPIDSLYIDIGAESREDAERLVSLGDVGVMQGEYCELENGFVLARALDDRCGCAVLISLLKEASLYDVTVCFTTQEEVGCRGALCAAEGIDPDIALVIDSTTACDIQNIPDEKSVCNLGSGGVVSFMDRGCIYDRELYSLMLKTAKENNIAVQVKRAVAGANDSSSIHKSSGGVRTIALSLPCRYLHTAGSVIQKNDLNATFELVKSILPRLCEL